MNPYSNLIVPEIRLSYNTVRKNTVEQTRKDLRYVSSVLGYPVNPISTKPRTTFVVTWEYLERYLLAEFGNHITLGYGRHFDIAKLHDSIYDGPLKRYVKKVSYSMLAGEVDVTLCSFYLVSVKKLRRYIKQRGRHYVSKK